LAQPGADLHPQPPDAGAQEDDRAVDASAAMSAKVLRLAALAQDFACGLKRLPQHGNIGRAGGPNKRPQIGSSLERSDHRVTR